MAMNTSNLKTLWHKLTSPHSHDEDQAQREHMTRAIPLTMSIIGMVITLVFVIGAVLGMIPGLYVLIVGGMTVLLVCSWYIAYHEHWQLSNLVQIGAFFAAGLYVSYVRGVESTAPLFYVMAVILATMFQGSRLQWSVLGLCSGAYLVMGGVQAQGILPPQPELGEGLVGQIASGITVLIGLNLLQRLYMTQFQHTAARERAVAPEYRGELDQPISQLRDALHGEQKQRENLQHILSRVRDVTNNLNLATSEILATAAQQAREASGQSEAISQTATTVDQVKVIVAQAATHIQQVVDAAQRTTQVSRAGQKAVQDAIESMEQIQGRVGSIAQNIQALSEQMQQIGKIITTVNEIATQSNMLALNASIEAARAGEHGRGFAVVAQEVRHLAKQSRQATAEVKAILSEIQKATNVTVMATEEGAQGVNRGMQLAGQAQEAIAQLAAVIDESAQAAVRVTASGQQQLVGIEQITQAMQNINQVTMQNLASARQTEEAAQGLNELACILTETVAQYQA